jgi:acetyl-CoA/propionyl-CoA/long-chain acyl-CoA carboxylase, biotin carboxylase, biotin carboxyl carrier protein
VPEQKVLIANRGEIAVRVIRTCRELEIATIAVYSDEDRQALHVEMADEAFHIGPAAPTESYLNIPKVIEAGRRGGATMVHPGYGFLAERADFAQAAADAGLTFIGPPPSAMAMLGDKIAAKQAAIRAGAPTVPGTADPVTPEEARRVAAEIGFPMVVKAAFGGGGKGMRLVERAEDLDDALERSAREAQAYFGRPELYLERYIATAHHVEAQIVADRHGHISFLGERDCSSQRRYQKLVEESPSPVVDDALRARIGEAAVGIAREAGYANAGTVEFLVEPDGSFYFMEVNARLQVEHPVTEMVTGLDLVRYQILVAMGEPVELAPALRGHSIECRLNAEDPYADFRPGPGLVTRLRPPLGPFVRLDAGVTEGRAVSGQYDSLFGKLIVWAEDRELARRRMLHALAETELEGIPSTIPFHRWLLDTPQFRDGSVHTKFVEQALAEGALPPPDLTERVGPAAVASVPATSRRPGRAVHLLVEVEGRRVPVKVWGDGLPEPPPPPAAMDHAAIGGDTLVAPMQGTILQVLVEPGQTVEAGQTVCILEAMKMENHIASARDGTVTAVAVAKGAVVETGQPLAVIE